mmetsp:Transcript_73678/g.116681  ORF Transcript_73678/g.116681 Transcript_73678/m.116681 type:complete len:304 (+) Transcript_73678:63-974(+)
MAFAIDPLSGAHRCCWQSSINTQRSAVVIGIAIVAALATFSHDHPTMQDFDDASLLQLTAIPRDKEIRELPAGYLDGIGGGVDWANRRGLPGECPGYTSADLDRPIRDVLLEHPGTDGYCYFGWMGDWTRMCAVARKSRDYFTFARVFDEHTEKIRTSNSTPVMIGFEGGNFTTLDHIHPLDDALCAVNGFWDYPVDPVLHDFEYLTNVSRQYCKRLEAEVPHFHNLTMRQFLDEEMDDDRSFDALVNSGNQSSGVIPSLRSNMFLHEAVKCLLGGVECDIANCVRRACKDDANVLKYGSDCS